MAEIKEVPDRGIPSGTARQVIYIVLSAGLGIAAVLGFVTVEQAEQTLTAIVNLAGALGFGLAAANRPKPITPTESDTDKMHDDSSY